MAQVFRTGFGSKEDVQTIHQPAVRALVAHLDSNCKTSSVGGVARRLEMVKILQHTVDKLITLDGETDDTGRPAYLADDSI